MYNKKIFLFWHLVRQNKILLGGGTQCLAAPVPVDYSYRCKTLIVV